MVLTDYNKKNIREVLFQEFKSKCFWCNCKLAINSYSKRTGEEMKDKNNNFLKGVFRFNHIDHVIPRSKGGTDEISNLVLSCDTCNMKRGNRLITLN